ncbi:MAG TPA: hypothetical protein VFY49_18425 [Myxococcota bacterium]|nr:hypothetical protein [Myxococcota bacterium]
MFSNGVRALCIVMWVLSAFLASSAWQAGDWRRLIEQFAVALVAAIMWLAVPPGAEVFRAPAIGTRGSRRAFYVGVLSVAAIAAVPWPWGDAANGNATALMFATAIVIIVLRAEQEPAQ